MIKNKKGNIKMKKKLLNTLKWLGKRKYIHIAYYQDEKQCVKRYNQNQLRIKLVKWLFSLHLSEIQFLNVIENKPLKNIYGIKFSDNEVETFESIDNWHNNIYTDYINYDAIDDKKGCVNQRIKDNKVFFKRNITCNYQAKSYKIEDFFEPNNKIITLVKKDDFEIDTVNYDKIEIDKNYFSFKLYGKEYLIRQKKKKEKKYKIITITQNLEDLKKVIYCKG